jgi:hypothetical protein
MDLSIGEIVLIGVVVWIVSQVLLGIMDAVQMVKIGERLEILKKLDLIIHQVTIENRNGVEYWYDKDNDIFLAQGKTIDEVISVLKSRFPDHIFLLEDRGGIAAQTNWKLMTPEEFKNIQINLTKGT